MPSKSKKQHNFMLMSLYAPEKLKKPAPKKVAAEFIEADKKKKRKKKK